MHDRRARLRAAANPRRAKDRDAGVLARLFTAAFLQDPIYDWIARNGPRRAESMERFFFWLLKMRAIPFGEVWMTDDASAAAAWFPPHRTATPGGLMEQMKLLPLFVRLCGLPRLGRGSALADAIERHHPRIPHYYLAFVGVAPRLQGLGLGSSILAATLARAERRGWASYLENSNPRNMRLYARHGFVARDNIAPDGAPPLLPMWRDA